MIEKHDELIKIILVGSAGVGKSSVLAQFADNKFSDSYLTTIGVDFRFKTLKIENRNIKFQIWDTAGQERFRTITSAYYKGADGVIIVYDVTDPSSFQDVDKFWVPEIENYATNGIGIILLGNKCDCEKAVDTEKANTYATFKGYDFQEVSAKTADNIFQSIKDFGRKVADKKSRKSTSQTINNNQMTSSAMLSSTKAKAAKSKKGCC